MSLQSHRPGPPADISPNVEIFLNDSAKGEVMSTNQLDARIAVWEREGRTVKVWAHDDTSAGFSIGATRLRVTVDPAPSITMVFHETAMTDKQQGWSGGLNLVFEEFSSAAWQSGLTQERNQAAVNMEAQIQRKTPNGSRGYQQTVTAVAGPFVAWLKGESLPSPPVDTALPEGEGQARNEALEIVLGPFESFVRGRSPESSWTWNEIADNLEKLVEYECRERSPDYRKAMADVVRPFYWMLKGEPRQTPPFNT